MPAHQHRRERRRERRSDDADPHGLTGVGAGPMDGFEQAYGNAAAMASLDRDADDQGTATASALTGANLLCPLGGAPGLATPWAGPSLAESGRPQWSLDEREDTGDGGDPGAGDERTVPQIAIDWVDGCLPVGLGVAVSGSLEVELGMSLEGSAGVTVTNQGGGWLEIEVALGAGFGLGVGVGGAAGGNGAELEAGGDANNTATRTYRVPWTRMVDLGNLAKLGFSAALGEVFGDAVEAIAPEAVIEALVGGHDLTPFLIGDSMELTVSAGAEGMAGAVAEELGLELSVGAGVSIGVEYDDLADEHGDRDGTVKIEGSLDFLQKALIDLSKTIGFDTECMLPHLHASGAVVIPFSEHDGDKTFAMPYLELAAEAEAGPVGIGGKVDVGPDKASVELHVSLDPGSLLWQKVLDDTVGIAIETLSGGLAEVETSGSMTLGVGFSLLAPELPDPAVIAPDVTTWMTTGYASPALTENAGLLDRMLASADVTLGVDLVIAELVVAGEAEAKEGLEEGVAGEFKAGLVYQRDDVLEDLEAPPTVDEALSYLRDPQKVVPKAVA